MVDYTVSEILKIANATRVCQKKLKSASGDLKGGTSFQDAFNNSKTNFLC